MTILPFLPRMIEAPMKQTRKRLGEMLLEQGVITAAQLNQALAEQVRHKAKLGQYLVKKGWVSEEAIADMVCRQLKLHRYDAKYHLVDASLRRFIPPDLADRLRFVPLVRHGALLLVGMLDPTDLSVCDEIVRNSELDVEPVLCLDRELRQLSRQIYGREFAGHEEYSIMRSWPMRMWRPSTVRRSTRPARTPSTPCKEWPKAPRW